MSQASRSCASSSMTSQQSWALSLVLFAVVADYVGVTMMRVALPFFAQSFGGSGTLIGSLETGYGIGQWLGAATLPRLSDHWGRRRVLILCCFCAAAGYSLAVFSIVVGSASLLLLSRLPVGLAKQTVTISRAVVADCTDANDNRSRWMAYQCTALAIGCSMGPLLASQAADISENAPVVIVAVMFLLLGPIVAITLPETSPKVSHEETNEKSSGIQERPLWRSGKVLLLLFLLGLPELGLVSHQGVALNTFSMKYLGMGKPWIANLNAISAVLQATFACTICAALSRRGWSDTALLQFGCGSFALASLAIWWWQTPAAVMYSAPLAAIANSVLRSFPAALLSKNVPEHRQGAAMGLLDICSSALRVLAPILAGACMDNFGGGSVFLSQAMLFIGAALGFPLMAHMFSKAAKVDTSRGRAAPKAA